ncbi:hypothetical protein EC973_000081 [Apophysomyces ossiformis]|uniref:PROP1-like PPR domain-containing protein n=1 Tax=Apophysomyces ossiformis TaxID=679940 RepID=A0A8H7EUQ2_9FUNG|nr:hypothetical protein EC973_000081 [Apophysomyces ossiformis]
MTPALRHMRRPLEARRGEQWILRTMLPPSRIAYRAYSSAADTNLQQHPEQKNSCEARDNPPDMILSAALEQFDTATAHSLYELTIQLLRKNNPMQAWECYTDITSRNMLRYLSRDQFRQLIAQFHHKSSYAEALEYVITLVEDMKTFQHRVGLKEKLLVMRLLGMNGKLKEMETIFEDVISDPETKDSQKHFNIILTAYQHQANNVGKKRVAERSMEIYTAMLDQGLRPTPATTRLLMENIRSGGNSDTAVETIWDWFSTSINNRTTDFGSNLHRELVMFFASAGRPDYALQIDDMMIKSGMPRDVRMMTALIHKVGRSGEVDKAMGLFNELINAEQCQPNIVTFNALIDIHAHKRPRPDFEGANRIYTMLHEKGLKANIRTFGTLIDMFAKEGDISMVRRLYKDMIANDIVPSPHIFTSLIECFVKNNDSRSAVDVLRILGNSKPHGVKPTEVSYNILIRSFVRDNDPKSALELLNLMKKAGLKPDATSFSPLLSYYADRGDVSNAQRIARHMSASHIEPSPHTYTILLEAYAKANDTEGAERVFNQLKQRWRPNTFAFNSLLYGFARTNETDKIFSTYKSMLKTYIKANEFTYGILMYYFSKRKEIKAVESLLDTMHTHGVVPGVNCWTVLMHTYFKCGRAEEGRQTMERMVQAGVKPNYVTLSILVKGLISADEIDAAESVVQKTIDRVSDQQREGSEEEKIKKAYPDRQPLADVTAASTDTYLRDLPTTIEDLLDSHRANRPTIEIPPPHLFDPLINAYRRRGDCDRAKDLFRKMLDLGVTVSEGAYISLMKVFMNAGQHDIVASMWHCLRQAPATIDIPDIGQVPYPSIERSLELLTLNEEELDFEESEKSRNMSSFSLSVYLDSLSIQGYVTDIERLWEQLTVEKFPFDDQSWNRYLVALVRGGKLAKACRIANEQFLAVADGEDLAPRVARPNDNIPENTDIHLHFRTCRVFADALNVPGAENMGSALLKMSVRESIQAYLSKEIPAEKNTV